MGMSLDRRRRLAMENLRRITVKRRALLGRWLDTAVDRLDLDFKEDVPSYEGMTLIESKEVHESLQDLRQFCETKGDKP